MKWYHWIWLPLVAIAGAVAYALGRRQQPTNLADEIEIVELRADIKERIAERDAESARRFVEARYAETLKRLDAEAVDRAHQLRGDPVALAEYLYRASL